MKINVKTLDLKRENFEHSGTGGVSENNSKLGFIPAFKDLESGRVESSKFSNGSLAPFHVMDGMPIEWILEKDSNGHVTEIKSSIISGFLRYGKFFNRDEAAYYLKNHYSH